ncbi:MAG: benzoate/H(+) symporter BenE family transporter [Proteobacteria bacterium]|nr:benzoate/H(+) symporter BenE family transporter [Pseudomonadota bacterium]
MSRSFSADFSLHAALQGLIVALVGYASSVAVVIAGLSAVGASTADIASGLLLLGFAKGLAAILLSLKTRMPISIAWTTPGLALLATTGAVAGGFPAAVGAFIVTGLLIILAGYWPVLARFVAAIPTPLASAMLAGVLLKFCLAPFVALKTFPAAALAILVTWLVFMRFARLYAVPAAVVVTLGAVAVTGGDAVQDLSFAWPQPLITMPVFTVEALVSLALPLFIVTMASQNITGLAVLKSFGYQADPKLGLGVTGALSALTAPFGAPTINFAAITAALCAGPDAHADPARRYVAAVFSGIGYIFLAALAAVVAGFVARSSPILIEAAAGLALIGAFGGAMTGALQTENARLPALMTFLITASGFSLWGIGAAFWGLEIGWLAYLVFARS